MWALIFLSVIYNFAQNLPRADSYNKYLILFIGNHIFFYQNSVHKYSNNI